MIKIGDEKLFTMTELLENLTAYLQETPANLASGNCDFEISAVAVIIGESADVVRGFVTSKRER